MIKIKIKQDFTTPGYPAFVAGSVCSVDDELASMLISRGLASEIQPKPKKKSNQSNNEQ